MDPLLGRYWDCLTMVAWAGGYFVTPFGGRQGVTRGKTLSPIIFNMVVDAVIFHFILVVAEEEAIVEGFGRAVQYMAEYFYDDDGLLASM